MSLGKTIFPVTALIALSITAMGQPARKPISRQGLARKACVSGAFAFKCPKNYKILLSGKTQDRLFFAKSNEFDYAVFVVYEPNAESMTESLPKLLKVFVPKQSQSFEWKNVEADPRKSSKYETESKRQIGFNGEQAYVTLEYRLIDRNGKKLLTGTIVNAYEGPVGIREAFEKGTYTTNGGCFDSVDIIAAFTKERLDPDDGPCVFTITMSPGN